MNPLDVLHGRGPAPAKLKVFAPNGDTTQCVGYLGIRKHRQFDQITELFLQDEKGKIQVLSKMVVVQNLETGVICYNPRVVQTLLLKQESPNFITGDDKFWLQANPHWPAILELQDNPVENGEEERGLNPA